MERRRYDRINTQHLLANLSDDNGFFSATICDISRIGLRISNVSRKLNRKTKYYWLVFTTRNHHFKLKVKPTWTTQQPPAQHIGLEIVRAPLGWREFVMESEPQYTTGFANLEI